MIMQKYFAESKSFRTFVMWEERKDGLKRNPSPNLVMAYKFSINAKLNAVLNEILDDLACIHDTEAESLEEIKHYMKSFPREMDYNLVQYGNMLIYYTQIRDMYRRCGYKSMDRMSDNTIWELYKRQTGYVARIAIRENLIAA